MNITEAQNDMCNSYLGGGPGVLISGIIWLIAGLVAIFATAQISILVFFFGGMLIHPLGILLVKLFGRSGKHQKANPLAKLAMEGTILLFIGLFIAYVIYQVQADWFYPIMLLIIGGRYLTFQTIYGLKVFWILGMTLVGAGAFCLISNQTFHIGGIAGGAIEIIFSIIMIYSEKNL